MAPLKGELSAQLTEGSSHGSALAQRALMPSAELSSSRILLPFVVIFCRALTPPSKPAVLPPPLSGEALKCGSFADAAAQRPHLEGKGSPTTGRNVGFADKRIAAAAERASVT